MARMLTVAPLLAAFAMGPLTACSTIGAGRDAGLPNGARAPDAVIFVKGMTWPTWAFNVKRSVERVKGVQDVSLDLTSGRVVVRFKHGQAPKPSDLWDAVLAGGFTPDRVETGDKVYKGLNR